MKSNCKGYLLCEKGLERAKMKKIKSISQKPGWMVFLFRFSQTLIYTVKTAEHLTLEINLLLSQIVLLVFSYQVFFSSGLLS